MTGLFGYILLSNSVSQNELQSMDAKWLVPTLITLGVFVIEIWTRIYKPYREDKITRKKNQIIQLKEEKASLERLTGELSNCVSNIENSLTCHGTNQIRLTRLVYPPKFVKNIENYNKFADILKDLSKGCEYYANTVVKKNALAHLADINTAPNEEIHSLWDLGSGTDNNLIGLMSTALKDTIISGGSIDKPLFDHLNPMFWDAILEIGHTEKFNRFMRDLNSDIKYQKDYGILNAYSGLRREMINITRDLIAAVKEEIELLDKKIDEL